MDAAMGTYFCMITQQTLNGYGSLGGGVGGGAVYIFRPQILLRFQVHCRQDESLIVHSLSWHFVGR